MKVDPGARTAASATSATSGTDGGAAPNRRDGRTTWARVAPAAVAIVLVVAVVLRFTTRSHLWLDEALSVNIARLPFGRLHAALRQDGSPPLYYVLLHGWISVFGPSDG